MRKCEVIAIIPARYGSTRLPGKPLKLISAKPMVQWVYERTAQCSQLDRVIVATDDQRIVDCVESFGGEVILSDGEFATGSDRVAGMAEYLNLSDDTILLNVQGDQPLINPKSLSVLVEKFVQSENLYDEMGTLGFIMKYTEAKGPGAVKIVLDRNDRALYFSRHCIPYNRDEEAKTLLTHLGVYIYSHRLLKQFQNLPEGYLEDIEKLEQLRVLENGYKIKVIMSDYDSPEVDTPQDIEKVESIIQQRFF